MFLQIIDSKEVYTLVNVTKFSKLSAQNDRTRRIKTDRRNEIQR